MVDRSRLLAGPDRVPAKWLVEGKLPERRRPLALAVRTGSNQRLDAGRSKRSHTDITPSLPHGRLKQAAREFANDIRCYRTPQIVALGMVAELRAAELAIGERRALLMGLTNARTSIDRPLAWPILQTMQDPHHAMMIDLVAAAGPAWRDAGTRWRSFAAASCADADATMPDAAPMPGLTV